MTDITPFPDFERGPLPDTGKSRWALYLEGMQQLGSAESMSRTELLKATFGEQADFSGMDSLEIEPTMEFLRTTLGAPEDFAREFRIMHPEERDALMRDPEVHVIVNAYVAMGEEMEVSDAA